MKSLKICLAVFFLVILSLNAEANLKKIAIIDFDDASVSANPLMGPSMQLLMGLMGRQPMQPEKSKVGKAVAEMLATEIVKDGFVKVIERNQLEKILNEHKLSASGKIDPSDAVKLGKLLGVSAILTGSVTQYSVEQKSSGFLGIGSNTSIATVVISGKLIDTTTAEIISAVEGKGEDSSSSLKIGSLARSDVSIEQTLLQNATKKALSQIVLNLKENESKIKTQKLSAVIAHADKQGGFFVLDIGKNSGIHKDMHLYVLKVTKEISSPTTGQVIKKITDYIADLKVIEVDNDSSTAVCISGSCDLIADMDTVVSSK
ncbi:MAG: CsgG/HfaB family protein [Thermodesulfovibrionales bacterium]